MRILQVNSAETLGGGETHVLELTEFLRSRGHQVTVAGRPGGAVQPTVQFPFRNSADIFTALQLRRFLQQNPFDIVHAHVARDYTVVAAAVWGLPVKLVCTRHLLYPVRRNPLYRRVDGWIAPTAQMLKTVQPLRPRRTAVIPNWVDLKKYSYSPHPVHHPITLGLLGQIAAHKGHEDAIEALRQLGSGYRLIVGGKGKDEYLARLREQCGNLPVEFLGFVEFQDFFKQVDILLVPSWEEPFGIVLLEAMAAGAPVISTSAGGPLEIIVHGESGILVPAKNPNALAEAIRSLAGSESIRADIAKHARTRVETKFDIQNVVPMIEAFYKKVFNAL